MRVGVEYGYRVKRNRRRSVGGTRGTTRSTSTSPTPSHTRDSSGDGPGPVSGHSSRRSRRVCTFPTRVSSTLGVTSPSVCTSTGRRTAVDSLKTRDTSTRRVSSSPSRPSTDPRTSLNIVLDDPVNICIVTFGLSRVLPSVFSARLTLTPVSYPPHFSSFKVDDRVGSEGWLSVTVRDVFHNPSTPNPSPPRPSTDLWIASGIDSPLS